MKKTGCLLLCLLLSITLLCACDSTYEGMFLKHNYQRDYNQIIATIAPITEEGDGWSYTSDEVDIRKTQLVSYINNYGANYVNSGYMQYNDMVDYFMEQLILSELVAIEADIRFESHDIFWTEEDIDDVQHSVYDSIDASLEEIYADILSKNGVETADDDSEDEDESTSTTYPVKPEEEEEVERVFDEKTCTYGSGKKHDDWYFDESRWFTYKAENFYSLPGNYGDLDTKSLAGEGVKRLVSQLADTSEDLINVTDEERKQIEDEVKELKDTIAQKGAAYAYMALGKTMLIKKLIGDTVILNKKMEILQDFIESGVTVTEEEIQQKYNRLLDEQVSTYADEASYDTAATGSDMVLYRANGNYVYVKHILIPFSDAQTEYLNEYKKINTPEAYEAERARQVNNIVAYRHVDGEDDKSHQYTVDQIWSEIRSKMQMVSTDPYLAERTFDDFIYEYNTDPGIFGKEEGYAVKYKLNAGESETYMTEFANAARAFRDDHYKVGEIYDHYIITDYGVHIMYYLADYSGGEKLTLNSYTTSGRYTMVADKIREDLLSSKTSGAFTKWQNERVYWYRYVSEKVQLKEKVFADLYQDEEE